GQVDRGGTCGHLHAGGAPHVEDPVTLDYYHAVGYGGTAYRVHRGTHEGGNGLVRYRSNRRAGRHRGPTRDAGGVRHAVAVATSLRSRAGGSRRVGTGDHAGDEGTDRLTALRGLVRAIVVDDAVDDGLLHP